MTWNEILIQIIEYGLGLVLSAVGILITFLINKYVKNDTIKGYVNSLNALVQECVQEVYQTYVESLKVNGAFDKEAQEKALALCLEKINTKLPNDLKGWLNNNQADIQGYLTTLIESTIYSLKNNNKAA